MAIITSPTGAALRDIIHVLYRRFRGLKITLIPALVQGEEAPASLVNALRQAQSIKNVDSLIITRGGGSQEDLWGFNSEELAREIFSCPIPLISAVGHEIDFTIADFVADLRAPTPSAAAELVVKNSQDLLERTLKIKKQLVDNLYLQIRFWRERTQSLYKQIPHPKKILEDLLQRTDELAENLQVKMQVQLKTQKDHVKHLEKLLENLNPKKIMERGYSIASSPSGEILSDSKQIALRSKINLRFFKGHAEVEVIEKK